MNLALGRRDQCAKLRGQALPPKTLLGPGAGGGG
jgi:hypothetical protein